MPTKKKRRLTKSDETTLDNRCHAAHKQGHKINVLLLPGDSGPVEICAQAWLPQLVLGVVRLAHAKFHLSMLVEVDRVPLLVIDRHGNEDIFHPTSDQPLTVEEFQQSFPHCSLTIGEWRKMELYLFGKTSAAFKAFY